jgi:hypothetical protein
MLKQTLSYRGETIITIYHKGFDYDVGNRQLRIEEKLGRFKLVFEEKVVPDNVLNVSVKSSPPSQASIGVR